MQSGDNDWPLSHRLCSMVGNGQWGTLHLLRYLSGLRHLYSKTFYPVESSSWSFFERVVFCYFFLFVPGSGSRLWAALAPRIYDRKSDKQKTTSRNLLLGCPSSSKFSSWSIIFLSPFRVYLQLLFFFFLILFIYLFLTALGLHCCARAFL